MIHCNTKKIRPRDIGPTRALAPTLTMAFSFLLLVAAHGPTTGTDIPSEMPPGSCMADTLRPVLHRGIIAKMTRVDLYDIPLDQVMTVPPDSVTVVTDPAICAAASVAVHQATGYPEPDTVIVIRMGDRGYGIYDVVRDDDTHSFFNASWTYLGALAGI